MMFSSADGHRHARLGHPAGWLDPRIRYERGAGTSDRRDRRLSVHPARRKGADLTAEERVYVASQWQLMWRNFASTSWRWSRHASSSFSICHRPDLRVLGSLWTRFGAGPRQYAAHARFISGMRTASSSAPLSMASSRAWIWRPFSASRSRKGCHLPHPVLCPRRAIQALGPFRRPTATFSAQARARSCFVLGTDGLGRDLFSRMLAGSADQPRIGLVGVAISLVLGCICRRHLRLSMAAWPTWSSSG